MRDIKSGRNSTMPRYNSEGKIWSDSLGEYVWEKVEYKDGDTYHWDDVNSLYWNDNGDEEDYLMITTDEGLPRNCTPIKNSRKSIKSSKDDYVLQTIADDVEASLTSDWTGDRLKQFISSDEDTQRAIVRSIIAEIWDFDEKDPDFDSFCPPDLLEKVFRMTQYNIKAHHIKSSKQIKFSKKPIKSGYYDDPVNHPEGGGVCDYCGAEIAPGDGYEEDFDSTWEEARSQLYAALTDDEPYNAPQSEWEFASWLGEDWSDDDVHDVLGEIVDMAYRGGKYPRYMCPDCNRKRIKEAAEKWVEENW